ncbi:MAG: hypothetical protein Q9M36_04520 [Sulfurovum sp.]|nr:hypothetical protein [Sulfurovum sp.]
MNTKHKSQKWNEPSIGDRWMESSPSVIGVFYNNEEVTIPSLNDPIIEEVVEQSNKRAGNYTLVAYDWSPFGL